MKVALSKTSEYFGGTVAVWTTLFSAGAASIWDMFDLFDTLSET